MITTSDVYALVIVYVLIAATLCIYVLMKRREMGIDRRKFVHILIGNFVFIWWMFDSSIPMLLFFTVPFMALLFLSAPDSRVNFLRESIIGDVSKSGHSYGLFYYVVSITVLVAFFFDHFIAASIGVVAMSYGDGFGSVVGRKFGKHRVRNGKSLEGSLGVFMATAIMTFAVILFYSWIIGAGWYDSAFQGAVPAWTMAILAGTFTSFVELMSPGEYDNLIIPLSVAALAVLLGF